MNTPLRLAFVTALSLAALPSASVLAYDHYYPRHERRDWQESYRSPYGRYRDYGNHWDRNKNWKRDKAMDRLARQEQEARMKAARRFEGNRGDPRYRERLGEIDRKYDHKRYKVERNYRNSW